MPAGDHVWLTPRSKHGRDVVGRHGRQWTCLRVVANAACKPGLKSCGLLRSPSGDLRWVAELDPDFDAVCVPDPTLDESFVSQVGD